MFAQIDATTEPSAKFTQFDEEVGVVALVDSIGVQVKGGRGSGGGRLIKKIIGGLLRSLCRPRCVVSRSSR